MSSRSTSLLDTLNFACQFLGVDEVTNYETPENEGAKKVKRVLPRTIDEVQSGFYWQELIEVETLSSLSSDPLYDDRRSQFPQPTDCLRVLRVYPENSVGIPSTEIYGDGSVNYVMKDSFIVLSFETNNDTAINCEFIKRDDNPVNWTPELERCIAIQAAIRAGYNVKFDPNRKAELLQEYEQLVKPRAKLLQSKYRTNRNQLPIRHTSDYSRAYFYNPYGY